LLAAGPFLPFKLRLGNGSVVPVPHPELLAFVPGGRTIVVTSRNKVGGEALERVAAGGAGADARGAEGAAVCTPQERGGSAEEHTRHSERQQN